MNFNEFRIGGNLAKYEIKHDRNTASDTTGFVPKRIEVIHLSRSQKPVIDVILRFKYPLMPNVHLKMTLLDLIIIARCSR